MGKRPARRLDLKKTLFLLPNMITLSAVFCGFNSIRLSAAAQKEEDFLAAALFIIVAMFFDMMDGRVARATKTQSAFGLQIDSIADVISFGAAPALLLYEWTLRHLGTVGLIASFLYVACAAIRLARFNVLTMGEAGKPLKPSKFIVGLPSPGAAGVLVSLIVANNAAAGEMGQPQYRWIMCGVTAAIGLMMVSTIKFRSFKELKLNVRTVLLVAFAIGSSGLISVYTKPAFVLVWLLGFYVVLGVCETLIAIPGNLRERRLADRDSAAPPAPPAA